jgi:serine/threonine protein kinase
MKNGDPECLDTLRYEFRLLWSLSHPHIIRASDASADMSWMALEFLDASQKLSSRVKAGGPLRPNVGMVVMRNLTSAVVYLHEHAVCHRDVKPENVLLVGDVGDMRLIDFNTARTGEGAFDCLSPGGDLDYSAPEVLQEGARFAADVWGIGATLYFALSAAFNGKLCFFQEAMWESTPAFLKQRIAVCLEIDPVRRPTADALWEKLTSETESFDDSSTTQSSECITPVVFP